MKLEFPRGMLDIIVNGKSAIDTHEGFQVFSLDEADRFIRSYGYNLDNPIERAEVFGNFHESLNFIRKYFLQPENPDGVRLEIPRKILELTDVRDLFILSSKPHPDRLEQWACAVLKLIHTIGHIDQDIRTSYFADIQKQIFDRYYRLIHRDPNEVLYLGEKADDPDRVDLVAFETKPKKARDSIILKLLHKPENVAEDIFDRVGLRFVTKTRFDALRVIMYLADKMLILPANIKPSRSRNTLIDLDDFERQFEELRPQFRAGKLTEEQVRERLESAAHASPQPTTNMHSSNFYRAIQFTSRQLIKLLNPLYDDIKELKKIAKSQSPTLGEDASKLIDRVDLKYVQKDIRFFYPYEIQVMDAESAEENEKGRGAHSEYKKAQIQTALKRVMGPLLS